MSNSNDSSGNELFPVFLKLNNLRLLIVGGGYIALEKLGAVLANSPDTTIKIVAIEISEDIQHIAESNTNITLFTKSYSAEDLNEIDIVIVGVNDIDLASVIVADAHQRKLLVNVADKPSLCDFYLGSVVKKGNLKVAISTNGKSPTIAKRLKETLYETLPNELDEVLDNMSAIRNTLDGGFANKVTKLNEITKLLVAKQADLKNLKSPQTKQWPDIVKWSLLAFVFMILGHTLLYNVRIVDLLGFVKTIPSKVDISSLLIMMLAGFLAQMTDGSLGMGYGTISTTFLLAIGVNPAIVSSRVHSARVFSSGVSGYSHHRFGNINKKLFKTLVIPGAIGAVLGAILAVYAKNYSTYVRVPLSFYTIYLGYYIIRKAIRKKQLTDKVKRAGWLAGIGGFTDAFAGGGWGALVTSTLISKRANPRYVIGSVCLAEFFVVLSSAITFLILLNHLPIIEVAGLIIGGVIAAPIAARLVGKIPVKKTLIAVGLLVILTSINTLIKSILLLIH